MKFGLGIILYYPDEKVLQRLFEYSKIFKDLIIIDNTDKPNYINKKIELDFNCYITEKKNLGMTKALEIIFNEARNKNIDWLLTMDQDSDFSNKNILEMMSIIEDNNSNTASIFCPNYRKIYYDVKEKKEVLGKPAIKDSDFEYVNFSMTSGSFIKLKDLENFIFKKDFFIGYVDNDLSYYLIDKGFNILMVKKIVFNQRVGEIVSNSFYNKTFKIVRHKEDRYYYMIRNNFYLQQKYKNNKKIKKLLKFGNFRIIINIFLGEKNKIKKLKYSFKGYKDFKKNIDGKIGSLVEEERV